VGGLVLFAGLLCLVGCAAIALAQIWPAWLAALVVGLAVTGAGVALVARGRAALKGARLAPRRTLASLQQTKLFARERAT
jgi:hypothetical protein